MTNFNIHAKLLLSCALLAALVPASAAAQNAPSDERSAGSGPLAVDEDPRGNPYVAGELIITLEEDVPASAANDAAADVGATVRSRVQEIDAAVLSVPEVEDAGSESARRDLLAEKRSDLLGDPSVESVDFNYLRTLSATPNDPRFGEQWGLKRIDAPAAWDTSRGAGSLIAIIDGGASGSHPDLAGAFVGQRDYYNNDATPNDEDGHGSHVSGIAAARTDNAAGIAGTAPRASLLNYDVCGRTYCTDAAINRAIADAADAGADVINLSLGGGGSSTTQRNAVNYAWNRGTVLVAAAGNEAREGNPVSYPAAYANVIAVGATDRSDLRAGFSNYGSYVDVVAPGTSILSSIPRSGYASWSGTSMATPFVSGVAALLASRGLTAQGVRARLEDTATDLGPTGRDDQYGYGLVDARAAVSAGAGDTPPPPPPTGADTTPPAISSSAPAPGKTGVPRGVTVTVDVSERLDPDSVGEYNVRLYEGGTNIAVAVSCDASCERISIDPASRLRAGATYEVVLWKDASGVRDPAGNPLRGGGAYTTATSADGYEYVSWRFKTRR